MNANDRRMLVGRCLVLSLAAVVAAVMSCSSGPTGPSTPTPTPATTVKACTASVPQPMTSFTVSPTTITDGDPLTLSWAAPCGYVSVAQTGQGPFATLQPSTGSYALRPGLTGYPTATGDTVYEAKNGDTAAPLHATVSMQPKATPTPTPAPCPAGTSCDDGDPCTHDDKCQSDGKTCRGTTYACCPTHSCDDGNRCTNNDVCQSDGATCRGTTITPCCGNGSCEAGEDCSGCPGDCSCSCSGRVCGGICHEDWGCCDDSDCDTGCWLSGGAPATQFCNSANNHQCQEQHCSGIDGSYDSCCDNHCAHGPC